jgi:hypothetical protein
MLGTDLDRRRIALLGDACSGSLISDNRCGRDGRSDWLPLWLLLLPIGSNEDGDIKVLVVLRFVISSLLIIRPRRKPLMLNLNALVVVLVGPGDVVDDVDEMLVGV